MPRGGGWIVSARGVLEVWPWCRLPLRREYRNRNGWVQADSLAALSSGAAMETAWWLVAFGSSPAGGPEEGSASAQPLTYERELHVKFSFGVVQRQKGECVHGDLYVENKSYRGLFSKYILSLASLSGRFVIYQSAFSI